MEAMIVCKHRYIYVTSAQYSLSSFVVESSPLRMRGNVMISAEYVSELLLACGWCFYYKSLTTSEESLMFCL